LKHENVDNKTGSSLAVYNKISHIPPFFILVLLFLLTILRNGFSLYGEQMRGFGGGDGNWQFSEISWRDPARALLVEVGNTFGYRSYILIYLLIVALTLLAIISVARTYRWNLFTFGLALSLLPGVTVILCRFGTLDLLSICFGILAGLTVGRPVQILYLVGMILSHVESSLLIILIICALGFTKTLRREILRVFGGTQRYAVLLFFALVIVTINLLREGQNSRASQFDDLIKISVIQFLASGTWLIFSWMGGLWLILISYLGKLSRAQAMSHATLIVSLGTFSILTADGTRVASNMLTFYTVALLRLIFSEGEVKAKWLLAGYLAPALTISNFNVFLPFRQIVYIFGGKAPLTEIEIT
jgi:hypothetical protein